MELSSTAEEPPPAKRGRANRVAIIVLLGVVAIAAGLTLRNGSWAKERRLDALSPEDLALAIHDDPNDSRTFTYYASALLKNNDLPGSERAFQRAVDLDGHSARARDGLGSVQLRRSELSAAKSSFEEAVRLDPGSTEAYLGLSQTLYQMGYAAHAVEPLRKILAIDPKNAVAWYSMGKLYGDAHESDKALDALQHAVAIDPKQAAFWRDLGQLNTHYSRLPEAEEDFKKALRLSPADATSYLWLGQIYAKMGDTPALRGQTEQALLDAIARDPRLEPAYYALGLFYHRRGNFALACTNLRKAVSLDSSDSQALYYLGDSLVKLGQTDEGRKLMAGSQALAAAKTEIDYLQKRTLVEPKDRQLRLRLARVYRKYENYEDALTQYQAYQRLGPADPKVQREFVDYIAQLKKQGVNPAAAAAPGMQ